MLRGEVLLVLDASLAEDQAFPVPTIPGPWQSSVHATHSSVEKEGAEEDHESSPAIRLVLYRYHLACTLLCM